MNIFAHAIPDAPPADIIAWAEANVKVGGGKTSFDASRTPQIIEPIKAMIDFDTRVGTLVKPVQVGGSTAGEVVAAWWSAFGQGLFQFNWEDELKAIDRWKDRIYPALQSCDFIRWTGARFEATICELRLVNIILRCQGVFVESNLDSDTVPLQINEEVHSWKPGHLSKARARQTQVWNAKAFDISNASETGDQLFSAYEDGTMEQWEVLCPGCNGHHTMRTRWEDNQPQLGGLRYDAKDCKMDNGRFNYNKLEKTIRYQMPCGHIVHDNPVERKSLNWRGGELVGRYTKTNDGAHISHRSWNFEAVCCDSIRWLDLIREKHAALRALKSGDSEPWRRYITERECRFYCDELRPFQGAVVITAGRRKNRTGLPGEAVRFWAADWQQGYKQLGELTHYWLVIESVLPNCSSQVIFAGQVADDMELLLVLKEHGITEEMGIADGVVDASKNTKQILSMCYRHGMNAVMGNASGKGSWAHTLMAETPEGKVQREATWLYYSPKKFIYKELNMPPRYDKILTREGWIEHPDEPFVIMYSKAGVLKNHFFIREMKQRIMDAAKADGRDPAADEYVERVVPEDIGDDYLRHHEAWERDLTATGPKKMGEVEGFKQVRRADHLMSCSSYIDLLKDMTGLLGDQLARMGLNTQKT